MRRRDHNVGRYLGLKTAAPPWLASRQEAAIAALREHGLPAPRHEDWVYTSPKKVVRELPLSVRSADPVDVPDLGGTRITFVDGVFAPELSRLDDTVAALSSLTEDDGVASVEKAETPGFSALNLALLQDGARIRVGSGPSRVHVAHVSTGTGMSHYRHLIEAGAHADVDVVETYTGTGTYWTHVVTEVAAADGAQVRHVRWQDESTDASHLGTVAVRQGRDSRFSSLSIAMGGAISRVDVHGQLADLGAEVDLRGLYLQRDGQHCDHHTTVEHASPHGTSRELFKGILDDTARGAFTGKIVVREGAHHSDSEQANNSLLLSDRAIANSRPQLEIYNDDVKCAHGATIGRIDSETLFYLRQRGLDTAAAQALLTFAFANEILGDLPQGSLRTALETRIWGWLGGVA